MGLSYEIHFPGGHAPAWDTIFNALTHHGVTTQLRMIDGVPALPDETPPNDCHELRITCGVGMLTLRRKNANYTCTVWGNADTELLKMLRRVVWVCAEVGDGVISDSVQTVTPTEFLKWLDTSE
jgi:hypothetical protein